ncbi:MAG: hypothetical protein HQK65_14310 [Desulfamplus sp.]|nr:hypothetical protein [Desulfamplus sp.]
MFKSIEKGCPLSFIITGFIIASFMLPANVIAKDFFEMIDYAITGTGVNKQVDAELYGARVTAVWNDKNGDKNIDNNEFLTETIKLYNRNGKLELESPLKLNKDGMEQWAEDNAQKILSVIFPGGLSQGTGSVNLRTNSMQFKTEPKTKTKSKKQGETQIMNNDFKAMVEHLFIEVNDNDGNAESILLGYGHESDSGLEMGVKLPYRYTSIDDIINSKSHYIGMDFYGKYPVKQWEDIVWNVGMDIFGSALYLTSDAIEHAGNLEYGAGIFTSLTKELVFGKLTVGMDYNFAISSLDSSLIDTDNGFVEEALEYINELDPVKTLSYGFNLGIPVMNEKAMVNLEVIRSNFFSDDIASDREAQTVAGISTSYYPTDTFELNLGVRKTFELEGIETTGIMLGAVYRY